MAWQRRPQGPTARPLRRLVREALTSLDQDHVEVSLLLTDDARIQELNRRYLDRDRPTDVLSFPDGDRLPDGFRLLGEIVISLDTARRQAGELGHSTLRELQELALHGVLHLLGYDHERDNGEMERLELRLREELL
ncbi:MAG: rRNA maturation RNase YbeY [Acidobacteria bacterium]|nr:rRNA maturation RNase YbeY [Acidobacteriota bacterium]